MGWMCDRWRSTEGGGMREKRPRVSIGCCFSFHPIPAPLRCPSSFHTLRPPPSSPFPHCSALFSLPSPFSLGSSWSPFSLHVFIFSIWLFPLGWPPPTRLLPTLQDQVQSDRQESATLSSNHTGAFEAPWPLNKCGVEEGRKCLWEEKSLPYHSCFPSCTFLSVGNTFISPSPLFPWLFSSLISLFILELFALLLSPLLFSPSDLSLAS